METIIALVLKLLASIFGKWLSDESKDSLKKANEVLRESAKTRKEAYQREKDIKSKVDAIKDPEPKKDDVSGSNSWNEGN